MMLDLIVLALLQAASAPASTAPQASPPESAAAAETDPRTVRRCRPERPTGTRFASRTRCTSPEEDERIAREYSREFRDMQHQSGRFGRDR